MPSGVGRILLDEEERPDFLYLFRLAWSFFNLCVYNGVSSPHSSPLYLISFSEKNILLPILETLSDYNCV